MAGIWHRETNALLLLASALPIAVMWVWLGDPAAVLWLVAILVVAGLWHLVFMLAWAQRPSFAGALAALWIAMLMPAAGPVPTILSVSFGATRYR